MEIVQLIIGVAIIMLLAILFIYLKKKDTADPSAGKSVDNDDETDKGEVDIDDEFNEYENLMPRISEFQEDETVMDQYKKFELPAMMKADFLQTFAAGKLVFEDSRKYKVEFSPEVVKGLKDKSFSLVERTKGGGFLPAVKKEGSKGFYQQAVLVRKVDPALVLHASFNLLSAVVGQQQLAEIQTALRKLEGKLDIIIQSRDNDFAGKIESRFSYFRETLERFRSNGIMLGGVEDQKVEDFYTDTLQDLKVLNLDLKEIGRSIDALREHETIRKWGEAPVIKDYTNLINKFNSKQKIVLLNIEFIEECYEQYLTAVRNYKVVDSKSQTLENLIAENNAIIDLIENKVSNIEDNYKVRLHFGVKALKYRNLENLKEVAPLKIGEHKISTQEVPSDMLVEITSDEKVYAYLPR